MNPKLYQFFLAMFAAFGSFLYGYDLGVIASVVASDSFANKFLKDDATTRSGTIVALFTAGEYNRVACRSFTHRPQVVSLEPSALASVTLSDAAVP